VRRLPSLRRAGWRAVSTADTDAPAEANAVARLRCRFSDRIREFAWRNHQS